MATGAFILVELLQPVDEAKLSQCRCDLKEFARNFYNETWDDCLFYSNEPLQFIDAGDWLTTRTAIPFYQASDGKNWLDVNLHAAVISAGI